MTSLIFRYHQEIWSQRFMESSGRYIGAGRLKQGIDEDKELVT